MFYRIIDANLNRATEGLRNIEEYTRFILNDKNLSEKLKNIRHEICIFFDKDYEKLLNARDVSKDIGKDIGNISKKTNSTDVLRANLKRTQQALRVLAEYGRLDDKYRYEIYELEKIITEKLTMQKQTDIKKALLKTRNIYLVTSSDNFGSEADFLDKIGSILESGVKILQYREKNKSAKEIISTGKKIRQLCSIYNSLFIVNDRVDIAQILDADGVHLGQDDIDINTAREILGKDKIIGISTHKPQDALEALKNNADYIGVGPVFKTPTKPNTDPVGLEYVKWVKKNIDLPFYAIGSIDETNVLEVIKAGASKVAVIRALMNSSDVKKTVEGFNKALLDINK